MKTIKQIDHCKLCDHQKKDFKTGIICGLTNEKPDFSSTCIKAEYNSVLQEQLFELVNHKLFLKKDQIRSFTIAFISIALGISCIVADYFFYNDYFMDYFRNSLTGLKGLFIILIGLFAAGLYFLKIGFSQLSYILSEKKENTLKLTKNEAILKRYGLRFEVIPYKEQFFLDQGIFVKEIQLKKTTTR